MSKINVPMVIFGVFGVVLVIALQLLAINGKLPNCILCQYQRLCLLSISLSLFIGSIWFRVRFLSILLALASAIISFYLAGKQLIMQVNAQFDQIVVLSRLLERKSDLQNQILDHIQQVYDLQWLLYSFAFWNLVLMSGVILFCLQYLLRVLFCFSRSYLSFATSAVLLGFFCSPVFAKDLGVHGRTFSIVEPDLIEYIQAKLKIMDEEGIISGQQKLLEERARSRVLHPKAVSNITRTHTPRSFTYNPSIVVSQDYTDHKGQVFAKKGTIINPFKLASWHQDLLFIDGEDEDQVALAIGSSSKIILVSGAPIALMEKLKVPVYFDQGGFIVKKLGITQVPARVSKQDEVLLIEEFKIPDCSNSSASNLR